MTTESNRFRTNAEGVAMLRAHHQAATTRIRHALSNVNEAEYAKAYAKLDEACGFIVSLLEMTTGDTPQGLIQ